MGLGLKKVWSKISARKHGKSFRKKLGLTSENKWARQLKRSIRSLRSESPVSGTAYSAPSYYHQARSLSQLTGGV